MKKKLLIVALMAVVTFSCKNQEDSIKNKAVNVESIQENTAGEDIYQFKVNDISGKEFDLASLKGKKVMIVNTASECGLTPQYEQLQALYDEIKGKNFYDKYDNFDAIEVPFTDAIPSDYVGIMGVPKTFLDKYNPDQFEILGYDKSVELRTKIYSRQQQIDKNGKISNVTKLNDGGAIEVTSKPTDTTYYTVDGKCYIQAFSRIFIKHKKK